MKSKFFSRFTKKQKIIAGILSAVMILTIPGGTYLGIQYQESAAASTLADPLTNPEDAFAAQKKQLSQKGKLWFNQSQASMESGDYLSALELINKVIEKDGELPLLILRRAAIYVALQNYTAAASDYSLVLASYPDYTMLYKLRGALYLQLENYEASYQDLSRYLKDVPSDTEFRAAHANLAVLLEKYEPALLDVNLLLERDSKNGSYLAMKGDLLTLLSRVDEAIPAYQSAVNYLSDPAVLQAAWMAIATLNQSQGNYKDAADALQKCVESNPDYGEAWFRLGVCQIQNESYKDAADTFSQSIRLEYEPGLSCFQRGLCYYSLGNSEKAIKDLLAYEASASEEDAANAYIYLALSYTDIGDTDAAVSYFKKCLSKNVMPSESHYYLGSLYLSKGNYKESVSHYTSAIQSDFLPASCYYNRGVAYLNLEDISRAQADFKAVVQLGSDKELTASAQNALNQIAAAQQAAIDEQNAALAQAQADALAQQKAQQNQQQSQKTENNTSNSESDNTQNYHTVIIKEGTLENPSAEINQNSENHQTSQ